jgi:very-short-patch-repair endonuclease
MRNLGAVAARQYGVVTICQLEEDGLDHHGTRAAFERDRARDQRLTAAGWTVLRLTHRQVLGEPERVREIVLSVRSRLLATP